MGFGTNLKELLKKRNMTIKQLSEKTGISLNTLYSITKRDTQLPSHDTIEKIAQALNVSSNELLDYETVKLQIHTLLDDIHLHEESLRKKLYEISELLSGEAIGELIDLAIELLQDEDNRSVFFSKKCKKEDNK